MTQVNNSSKNNDKDETDLSTTSIFVPPPTNDDQDIPVVTQDSSNSSDGYDNSFDDDDDDLSANSYQTQVKEKKLLTKTHHTIAARENHREGKNMISRIYCIEKSKIRQQEKSTILRNCFIQKSKKNHYKKKPEVVTPSLLS